MALFATEVALVGLAVVCAAFLRLLFKYIEFRRHEMAIPGPPSLFLLGNTLDFLGVNEKTVIPTLMKVWGGRTELSRFSIGKNLMVFVTDPDDLAIVFGKKEYSEKSRFLYEFFAEMLPKGLLVLHNHEWRCHRGAMQPAYAQGALVSYEALFADEAERFCKRIVPDQEQDVYSNLQETLLQAFLRTSLDYELDNEEAACELKACIPNIARGINDRSFNPLLWSSFIYKRTKRCKTMNEYISKARLWILYIMNICKSKMDLEETTAEQGLSKRRNTLLGNLLKAQGDKKMHIKIQDEHVQDEILMLGGAAVETTSSTLSSIFKCLSLYPEVQERLYAEVKGVFGEAKRSVTMDDLAKMPYLDQVIKETLRVLPAVPFVWRQVREQTVLAGKVLPPGTTLMLNFYGLHRDPRHWVEPLRFNPDRFENANGRHPYAFLPFSAGPRNCIAGRYAMQLTKTVLATTLRDFQVDRADDGLTDHNQLHLSFDLALRVVGGTRVTFTPRRT